MSRRPRARGEGARYATESRYRLESRLEGCKPQLLERPTPPDGLLIPPRPPCTLPSLLWVERLAAKSLHEQVGVRGICEAAYVEPFGVMQMFDLATAKLPEHRPDFAIFAFITGAMGPGRIWRFEAVVDGEPRVFTVTTADRTTDETIAHDTFILHPRATLQWCQSVKGGSDDLAHEIVDKHVRLRGTRYSPLDPSRSFLWNKIVKKDPFSSSRAIDRISRNASRRPFSSDSAENSHPSSWAMQMFATGALRALLREKLVGSDR